MDTFSSPPMSPVDPSSPTNEHFRRRNSSLSSNYERSPASVRSRKRFSNASQNSSDWPPDGGGGGGGMGNLADELDQLDDDEDVEEEDEDITEAGAPDDDVERLQPSPVDGARDSGVDVSYSSKTGSPHIRNSAKPPSIAEKVADEEAEEQEDRLTPELEDLVKSVAHMASYASTSEDPLIPRLLALLQDLGNQSNLEAGVQRLNTSTNSMTTHLSSQSKTLQGLMTSLYSPLAMLGNPLDPEILEETVPLIETLLADLPRPDPAPLQGVQKLARETDNAIQTLSQLTDTVQMGKHTTNTASRHLRTTQTMVAELRHERERAETARDELRAAGDWHERIQERWCAGECKDIMGGFERMCDSLRENLVQAGVA